MAKPKNIELTEADISIPILYENRSVMAIDKPAGWMLAPDTWDHTGRNLQLALQSSINAGDYWAHSRNLKYLRFIHRLDAETTGITLFAKSAGALTAYSALFEERRMEKRYLAVVHGIPKQKTWTCELPLVPDPGKGRMIIAGSTPTANSRPGAGAPKDAATRFTVLQTGTNTTLVEAEPLTGRTHQIRIHLAETGYPIVGDPLYGTDPAAESKGRQKLGLRAIKLVFRDPFLGQKIYIEAPVNEFLREYGFDAGQFSLRIPKSPPKLPA